MDFFQQHKNLFQVDANTRIPTTRLSINNNLFIDKPFLPTYTESYSINSKLRALKKDYNELEESINDFDSRIKTPRRTSSRKGRQLREALETDNNSRNLNSSLRRESSDDPLKKKKGSWLKDDQKNLLKHTEINHIFNHQIKEEYPIINNVKKPILPKAENFLFGAQDHQPPRPQRNQRNQNHHSQSLESEFPGNDPNNYQRQSQTLHKNRNSMGENRYSSSKPQAHQRRKESKKNLNTRRQKLKNLLKAGY